jgi:hypothetical protein
MTEDELTQLAWDLVDDTIEHVFLRFPENCSTRASVYRRMAANLMELAEDLDLA